MSNEREKSGSQGEQTTSLPGAERASGTPASGRRLPAFLPTFEAQQLLAGRYRIVRFIAQGGMGEVYEAEDGELGTRVALKTIRPEIVEQEGTLARFKREITLSRQVTHPNVCRIFDLGYHVIPAEGQLPELQVAFLSMELLDGETLSRRIRRLGKLKPEQALPIVRQMVAALCEAHDAGIIHRDFKSANVMLVPSSKGERAVVADFGLAHVAAGGSSPAGLSLTGAGKILGTPAYMAPEQVEGKPLGPAADLYALGVVMFEMVTGRWPFIGEDPLVTAALRLKQSPPVPSSLVPELDARWDAAILRCLERHPADRFESAADVARALGGEIVPAGRRARRRSRLTAAAAVLLAAAAGVWVSRGRPTPSERGPAPGAATRARRSIAVLGFKNLGRSEAAWLSTAVAEMLRTELGAGGALRTIPGENVARVRVELALAETDSLAPDTLERLHGSLGADLVVLGSYLSVGKEGRIRFDLRLQDTASGEVVASVAETGTEADVFELVAKAGAKLRGGLGLGAVSDEAQSAVRASLPSNAEARQLYAEGLATLQLFDVRAARDLLQKAVAADPGHALSHSALAAAWFALGYDAKAKAEAQQAVALARQLPRDERLAIEALLHSTGGEWDKAVDRYRSLFLFFPDNLEHGLRLAEAQTAAGQGEGALATIDALRTLQPPSGTDPRIDLAEAAAAKSLTDYPRQQRAAAAAASKAERSGSRLLLAEARLHEGTALVNMDRPEPAKALWEEAAGIFAAAGDKASLARTENIIGVSLAKSGATEAARGRFEAALRTFRAIGDQRGIAQQLENLGNVEAGLGRSAQAKRLFEQALGVSREAGDRSGAAVAQTNLGATFWELGDLDAAQRAYEDALRAYTESGAKRNQAVLLFNIAEVLQKKGRLVEAREKYEACLALYRGANAMKDAADALTRLGAIATAQAEHDTARRHLEEALRLYRENGEKTGEAEALEAMALLLEHAGDHSGAQSLRQQASALVKTGG